MVDVFINDKIEAWVNRETDCRYLIAVLEIPNSNRGVLRKKVRD